MQILLITDSYPPEIRSASHLMQEMAEGLRDRGHNITVATSYPKYNRSDEFKGKKYSEFSVEDKITIMRIKTFPHHKVNFIIRGISQLTMPYIFMSKLKKYLKCEVDVVIVYSPPLPLAVVGRSIKEKHKAKFILNIQDIFPQNAIDLGILKNKFLINLFQRIEKKAYKCADKVVVHSDGNKEYFSSKKQIAKDKLHVLHNWVDITAYGESSNGSSFREKYMLENKFVFLFAGVIGPSQGLDLLIEVAGRIKEIEDICFLFVGDGSEKKKLIEMAENYNLKNIVFKPFISKQQYISLLKEIDVGVVCLSSKNKTPVVPGKMIGYMAASIPVVAFLHKESDGHQVIRDAECGYSAVSDNIDSAVEITRCIFTEKDRFKHFGKNGLTFARNHFSRDICLDNLEKLF